MRAFCGHSFDLHTAYLMQLLIAEARAHRHKPSRLQIVSDRAWSLGLTFNATVQKPQTGETDCDEVEDTRGDDVPQQN